MRIFLLLTSHRVSCSPRCLRPILSADVVLAAIGAQNFSATLENFLLVIGYWGTIYVTVILLDDALRKGQYDVHIWNSPNKLPHGWAAAAAMVMGIVGAVLGMAQVWYIGVIAQNFGPFGGDLGPELACLFAGLTYLILRPLERKYSGRN